MLAGMDPDGHKDSAAAIKHDYADIYRNPDKDSHGNLHAFRDTHIDKYRGAKYGDIYNYNYKYADIHAHSDPDFDWNKLFHIVADIDKYSHAYIYRDQDRVSHIYLHIHKSFHGHIHGDQDVFSHLH